MNTIMTDLRDALKTFVNALETAQNQMIERANTERKAMLDLLASMRETREGVLEMASITSSVRDTLDEHTEISEDLAQHISNTLDNPASNCPETPYEDFVGFCSSCGEEVSQYEDYTYTHEHKLECEHCSFPDEETVGESISAED